MGLFSKMGERRRQRRAERRQDREDRIALRQQGRTERAYGRQSVRSTAYQMGMDPNAFVGQGFDALGKVGEAYVQSQRPDPRMTGIVPGTNSKFLDQTNEKDNTAMYIVLAAVAYFLLNKKKK